MAERPPEPDPARVVADADVLAADLLVGGEARAALDHVRRHSWVELVASDRLVNEAAAVIEAEAGDVDSELAEDWRERIDGERVAVEGEPGDHPALASAVAGNAAHLLSFDGELTSAGANLGVQPHLRVSIRTPAAFAATFDPEALYPTAVGGSYPGPDRDPRA